MEIIGYIAGGFVLGFVVVMLWFGYNMLTFTAKDDISE